MEDLYIIGAGSVGGHLAINLNQYSSDYNLCGFFDDSYKKIGEYYCGIPVLGSISELNNLEEVSLFLSIALPKVKKKIYEQLKIKSRFSWPSFVHKKTWVSNEVEIGSGSIIYPGTTINYGSSLGGFAVVNMNCSLGHHTFVGNFASLAPGVNTGGHTTIEDCVEMGIGSSTVQDVVIGENSVIGGAAMVTKSIPANSLAVGVPARNIRK